MSLRVVSSNNKEIYNLTGHTHHNLPQWMVAKNKASLKKDIEWRDRIQLLQDFEFPESSQRLRPSKDQRHFVATGIYKPQIRVFDTQETSLKFERHLTAENVDLLLLGEDWKKACLLQADRSIEFHTPQGLYHSIRLPRKGQSFIYDPWTCDLLIGGSSPEIFRVNLDRGQFLAPLAGQSSFVSQVAQSTANRAIATAGDEGVELWDSRKRESLYWLPCDQVGKAASSVAWSENGISLAIGRQAGFVECFDLRRLDSPIARIDHFNGDPIFKLEFLKGDGGDCVASADEKCVKFSNLSTKTSLHHKHNSNPGDSLNHNSEHVLTVESSASLHDFCIQGGLLLTANDAAPIGSYFIPALGPAPRWCAHLDRLTEEMAESSEPARKFENFKFIDRKELFALGLDHLVGSPVLRAHLHGWFIDYRLWMKAKAISNPFEHEEWVERQRAAKLEAKMSSRINLGKFSAKGKNESGAVEVDDRFKAMLEDKEFEIDTSSAEFLALHPRGLRKAQS